MGTHGAEDAGGGEKQQLSQAAGLKPGQLRPFWVSALLPDLPGGPARRVLGRSPRARRSSGASGRGRDAPAALSRDQLDHAAGLYAGPSPPSLTSELRKASLFPKFQPRPLPFGVGRAEAPYRRRKGTGHLDARLGVARGEEPSSSPARRPARPSDPALRAHALPSRGLGAGRRLLLLNRWRAGRCCCCRRRAQRLWGWPALGRLVPTPALPAPDSPRSECEAPPRAAAKGKRSEVGRRRRRQGSQKALPLALHIPGAPPPPPLRPAHGSVAEPGGRETPPAAGRASTPAPSRVGAPQDDRPVSRGPRTEPEGRRTGVRPAAEWSVVSPTPPPLFCGLRGRDSVQALGRPGACRGWHFRRGSCACGLGAGRPRRVCPGGRRGSHKAELELWAGARLRLLPSPSCRTWTGAAAEWLGVIRAAGPSQAV